MPDTHPDTARPDIARYEDVPLVFEAELDRRHMTIRELLSLEVGKTLPLARAVGEDLPIYVGGALIGLGEVIRLTHSMGVRISSLTSPR